MVVSHQGAGLKLVDHPVRAGEVPIGVGAVPPAVEPDPADLAVVGAELADLPLVVSHVALPVAVLLPAGGLAGLAQRKVVGVVPIEQRIIEE